VKTRKAVKPTKDGLSPNKPGPKPKTTTEAKKSEKAKANPKKKPLVRKVAPKKKVTVKLKSSSIMKPPPRACSPYTLFVHENLKGKQGNATSNMKSLAHDWNNLPESEKEVFKQRAREERVIRREKFDQYMAGVDPLTLMRFNRQRRKEGKQAVRSPKGVHERRPTTPFFTFMAHLRAKTEFSGWNMLDLSKEGGKQWRTMTTQEKAKYAAPVPPNSE